MTIIILYDLTVVLTVDLRDHISDISPRGRGKAFKRSRGPLEFTGECQKMDTSSLDKQAKQHLKVYENVMFAAKVCIVAIIATLVIMAVTLV